MQNQTIFEFYADDNISKYSSNPKDILKSAKKSYEKLCTKRTSSAATTDFYRKIPNRRKISNEHFKGYLRYKTFLCHNATLDV